MEEGEVCVPLQHGFRKDSGFAGTEIDLGSWGTVLPSGP